MSPPLPPSPPSGPPNSTNFSRRKLTAPGPPAPERTKIFAWSRKCMGFAVRRCGGGGKPYAGALARLARVAATATAGGLATEGSKAVEQPVDRFVGGLLLALLLLGVAL